MQTKLVILMAVALVLAAVAVQADSNVALGRTITSYLSDGSPASAAYTVVDGVWLAERTYWQDAFWWTGTSPYFEIDLGGQYVINAFSVQADNNDTYRVSYKNSAGSWVSAWEVPTRYNGGGMSTRPDPGQKYTLPTPITTNWLRFQATGGDFYYSVSEIQAFGTPSSPDVPEPCALVLALSSGLVFLPKLALRRRA